MEESNCACGQVESTSHFVMSCKTYTDLRNELMYTINYPNLCFSLLSKSFSHPVSSHSFWIDVNFVPPVTIRAASLWIFSILFIQEWVCVSQTTSPYSHILEISSKTKFYSDYFLPSSIKLWNRLPIDTRNSRSLNIFCSPG
jgi:hypothetical protein